MDLFERIVFSNKVVELLIDLNELKEDVTQNIPKDVLECAFYSISSSVAHSLLFSDIDGYRNPNLTAKSRLENAAVQNQFAYAQISAIQVRSDPHQSHFRAAATLLKLIHSFYSHSAVSSGKPWSRASLNSSCTWIRPGANLTTSI